MSRLLVLLALASGCALSPEARADIVCNSLCDCAVGSTISTAVENCVQNQCLPQLPPVTDECLACIHQHESSCPALQSSCISVCLQTQVPSLNGGSQ